MKKAPKDLSGCRILIVGGIHAGQEGICLGRSTDGKKWSVSPDDSNMVLDLMFDEEFGLLLDMSSDAGRN